MNMIWHEHICPYFEKEIFFCLREFIYEYCTNSFVFKILESMITGKSQFMSMARDIVTF